MPVTMALVGAGQRGLYAYGPYAIEEPDQDPFRGRSRTDP